jgi:ribosome-binding factor A
MRRQANFKHKRIESDIQRAVSDLISRDVKDQRVERSAPIVQRVSVTKDIARAHVYITFLNSDLKGNDRLEVMRILQQASGYFQSCLGKLIRRRFTPRIIFVYDDWNEEWEQIDQNLEEERESLASLKPEGQDPSTDS